jgi:spoIIIJ-associated protein
MPAEPARSPKPPQEQSNPLDREALVNELKRCLDTIVRAGGFDLRYQIRLPQPAAADAEQDRDEIVAELDGPDSDLLLERGAELLHALEHVAVRWLRLDRELHERIRLDCGNYHADRVAELKLSAQVAADRVRQSGTPFRFNPMTAADRRIIHLAMQGQAGVRTASEGFGPQRRVVVFPAVAR